MNLWWVGEYTEGGLFLLGGMSNFLASGLHPYPPVAKTLPPLCKFLEFSSPLSEEIGRGSYELPTQDYISKEASQDENFYFLYNFNKNTTI